MNVKILMNKVISSVRYFWEKNYKSLYYIVPLLAIIVFSFLTDFFIIDKKVINKDCLWDMAGRPYETFLDEMNLPNTVGAVFVGGTPDNLIKTEKYYKKVNVGDIFTSQLRSFLFGTKITEYSIASYINFIFGVSAVLFSILAGYLIFKNGYISIAIFTLIMAFRNFCRGLIYGLPLRHEYAVFNPLIAFSIIIFLIIFLKDNSKKYWIAFILSGLAVAYAAHCRTSEGQIIAASLAVFAVLVLIEYLRIKRKDYKKLLVGIAIVFIAMYAGYSGYYKMVAVFEKHRDKKMNFQTAGEKVLSAQPAFHSLFISLFRYAEPNGFSDKTGFDVVYARYPEIKKKFADDINYFELNNSEEYNIAVKKLYFEFILDNPGQFLIYLGKSIYDYFLFLPYYSWTGDKSAHAYLPKINKSATIERNDLAPNFKDTPFNWIINLRLKYLPGSPLFWIYFTAAYALLGNAVYAAVTYRKNNHASISTNAAPENNLPIYLLQGMLIYFFFASVVRILIPVHGQGAVVAFNLIIIYNLVRLIVNMRNLETKKRIIQAWALLLVAVLLFSAANKLDIFRISEENTNGKSSMFSSVEKIGVNIRKGISNALSPNIVVNGKFHRDTSGWTAYQSALSSVPGGQSGNCLQITATDNTTGYAYIAVPTKIGKMYKFKGYYKKGRAANGQIKVGTGVDDSGLYYSGVCSDIEWRKRKGIFRATAPTTYITLVNLTSAKGETSFFDSISLAEIEDYSDGIAGKNPE